MIYIYNNIEYNFDTNRYIYSSLDDKYIFIINLKCGYSTFQYLVKNGFLKHINLEDVNLNKIIQTYMIIRNPYDRLLSVYYDKFIRNRHNFVQKCQLKMLNYVSFEKIQSGDFSFKDFIHAIKNGYIEEHLFPQFILYDCYTQKYNTLLINFIHLENNIQMKSLFDLIGSPFIQENITIQKDTNILSDKIKHFIHTKYTQDFILGNYIP